MKNFVAVLFVTNFLILCAYSFHQQHACDACHNVSCLDDNECRASPKCTMYRNVKITDEQKNIIESKHNELRNKVASGNQSGQPSATNMKKLKWDNELANIAQCFANQCEFKHMNCDFKANLGAFGQNLYVKFTPNEPNVDDLDYAAGIQSWYDEVSVFPSDNVDSYQFDRSYGHYSQVVWANTSYVGCGSVVFYDGNWWDNILYCNYYPTGNYDGATVYMRGEPPASNCDHGTGPANDYPALCDIF